MSNKFKLILVCLSMLFQSGICYAKNAHSPGEIKMKKWSLGRIDFSLPQDYVLVGRTQNIYYVDVLEKKLPANGIGAMWEATQVDVRKKHTGAGYPESSIQTKEIEADFKVIFYKKNKSNPDLVSLLAMKTIDKTVLEMEFEGKVGKENDMQRGITIIAHAYQPGAVSGFSLGEGSITSTPGVNESSRASFRDNKNGMELNVSTHVATSYLNKHPLDDIDHEIKGLAQDDISLKVLKNEQREVAGFAGYEGLITFEGKDEPAQFRFTWFTPGVTADPFKPEILIKVHGPLGKMDDFKKVWDELLKSLKMRGN